MPSFLFIQAVVYTDDMKKGKDYTGISVVYMCHDGKGNYLLNKRGANCRDEHYRWDIGGGSIEFDVSVEETLKCEIQEEYGTDVLGYEFLGYRDVHRIQDGVKTHWVALDFKVLVDRKKAKNGEPHKFEEVRWFTLDSFPEPMHSQLPSFLENYNKHIKQ